MDIRLHGLTNFEPPLFEDLVRDLVAKVPLAQGRFGSSEGNSLLAAPARRTPMQEGNLWLRYRGH